MGRPDIDILSSTIGALYGVVDGTSSWADAAGSIIQSIGAQRFIIITIRPDGSVRQDSWPVDPEGVIEYDRDYAHRDLRISRASRLPPGLYTTGDLMTPEEIRHCPVHQEFYRKWPECWNTAVRTSFHEDHVISSTIQRGAVKGEFEKEELAAFATLAPHISRTIQLSETFNRINVRGDELIASLDCLDDGILVLSRTGAVEHMNGHAREIAAGSDGFFVEHGFMVAAHRDERASLEHLISGSLRVAAGVALHIPPAVLLSRKGSPHPLIVSAFVVKDSAQARLQVVLKVKDTAKTVDPSLDVIRRGLGLTLAEAKLALALAEGLDMQSYAEQTRIGHETVKTHLRHMREKIGVRRQSEIIQAVTKLRP